MTCGWILTVSSRVCSAGQTLRTRQPSLGPSSWRGLSIRKGWCRSMATCLPHRRTQAKRPPVCPAPQRRPRPAKPAASDGSTAAPQNDEVTISPEAQELQRLVQSAHLAEDIRGEQVEEIRTRIRTGAYMLDPQAIAAKMLGLGGQ